MYVDTCDSIIAKLCISYNYLKWFYTRTYAHAYTHKCTLEEVHVCT